MNCDVFFEVRVNPYNRCKLSKSTATLQQRPAMEFENATRRLIRDSGVESRTNAWTRFCRTCVSPTKNERFARSCKVNQKLSNRVAFSNSNFLSNRRFFLMVFWRETFVELEKVVLEGCMGTVKKVGRFLLAVAFSNSIAGCRSTIDVARWWLLRSSAARRTCPVVRLGMRPPKVTSGAVVRLKGELRWPILLSSYCACRPPGCKSRIVTEDMAAS